MKRFTALLLLVLLAIAPFSASLADTDTESPYPEQVEIWGKTLNSSTPYYHNGDNGGVGTVDDVSANWNAHYDTDTGVLTLKNLNVKNSDAKQGTSDSYYGINVVGFNSGPQSDTLIIVLEGENTVSSGKNTASNHSNAISLLNLEITIKGSGKLTATGGTTDKGISKGVNIERDLTMTGGSVTCKGGTSGSNSCGMELTTLTVSGGTLICEGGNGSSSYGVLSNRITVSGGTMEGKGGTANGTTAGNSCGVLSFEPITVSGGSIKGTGGTAKIDSYGVHAKNSITVENGSITGTGDTATVGSYGVYAEGSITADSGGYLHGTGGTAAGGNSYGVYIEKNGSITLNDGATTLAQGHTQALNIAPTLTDTAVASENYDGSGAVTYDSADNKDYKYFRMPETIPATQITVTQDSFPYGQAPENETITVTSNDAIFNFNASNSFGSATMDGRPIDLGSVGAPGAHGSVRNGSIVIQLNKAYLDTLPAGTHTLRVNLAGVYTGAYVKTQITVLSPADVPKTGDSATPMLWLGILLLAGAGLAVSAVRRKRQNG